MVELLQGETFEGCFTDINNPCGVVLKNEAGKRVAHALKGLGCEVDLKEVER